MRLCLTILFCMSFLVAEKAYGEGDVTYGIIGDSTAEAADIVTAQGFGATILTDLSAGSLVGIDVIWALNANNGGHLGALTSDAANISAFVNGGGVLMYHDRFVTDANLVLPGIGGITFTRDTVNDAADIDVLDNTTLVTNGPGGIVDDFTLDGGTSSSHGFATLPGGFGTQILSRPTDSEVVDFSFEVGGGDVYYSSIPLDFYLSGNGAITSFADVYAPNVVGYSASLFKGNAVPEPSSILVLTGLVCGIATRRRRV